MGEFLSAIGGHTHDWLWLGLLFIITGLIVAYLALFGKQRRPAPMKIWLVIACYWQSGMWVSARFITAREGPRTAYGYGELLIAVVLLVVLVFLLIDLMKVRRISFSLPAAYWERIALYVLVVLAVLYPLYMMLWGRLPNVMLLGIGPFPTFMFAGALVGASVPKVPRWMAWAFFLASLSALLTLFSGMWDSVIMVLPCAYLLYVLLWRKEQPAATA